MYVLVDLGYLMFYRYHATLRWLEFQKIYEQEMSNDYIAEVFEKHLRGQLDKLKKKYKGAKFIFCKDEKQARVWRKAVFPEYKANRGVADDMVHKLQGIVLDVVGCYGTVLGAPSLEADDVAFLIVKHIRQCDDKSEIFIVTSDRDYLQMVDDRIQIVDGSGKWITGSGDSKRDLWTKIIMGDKSDNIPPIAKGCGKKTAEALASDPTKLAEYVQKKGCSAELARNELLICMDKIPDELVTAFYEANNHVLRETLN